MRRLGGFDERFFLYLEDADIGRRVNQVATSIYHPELVVVHKWARGTHTDLMLWWETVRATFIYWRKWGGWI